MLLGIILGLFLVCQFTPGNECERAWSDPRPACFHPKKKKKISTITCSLPKLKYNKSLRIGLLLEHLKIPWNETIKILSVVPFG